MCHLAAFLPGVTLFVWLCLVFLFYPVVISDINNRVENAKNTPEEILEETNTETNKESESTSKTKESKENSKIILKTEWDVLDSYLSLMQSCLDGLTNAGKVGVN